MPNELTWNETKEHLKQEVEADFFFFISIGLEHS